MTEAVRFGDFSFDLHSERLFSGANEVRLTPKAAAVLGVLVRNAARPVSKAELFATVWHDAIVGDDALTSCVQELRRGLGDDPKRPRFIETRHRRGYLFKAALGPATGRAPATAAAAARSLSTIAVLPFADMSPAHDQGYLCDGLAEELIGALTRIEGLQVAARTASFQFRAPGAGVREVGRALGVAALLEGSVRKSEDRLRVTVQLVEAETGFHRWSQRYDRKLDDVFAVQDEIARSVATALRGAMLSPREREALARPQTGAAAYEFYLRGRQLLPRMTQADLDTSRAMFERALERDAAYGPAWAGLATARATLYEWFGARPEDLAEAERASARALALAPGLAEAHVARGFALALMRRHDEATRRFEEAIAIDPNLFDAYYCFARAAFARGEVARSAELFRKAAQVRREDFQSSILLGQALRMLGRADEARDADREGIRRAERMLALNPLDNRALSLGARALLEDGQDARAHEWSERSLRHHPDDPTTLFLAACLRARRGQAEETLDLLERIGPGCGKRDWLEHDPDWDLLRGHPRFVKLLAGLS